MLSVLLCMMLFGEIRAQQSARSANVSPSSKKIATLDQVLAAKQDLWGLAAMQQPNGASYEFFANILPPLRYVNAKFHYYPIVLSAPGSLKKAWLISNGSAVNARPELQTWRNVGTPALFFVGKEQAPFGENISALNGPHYERGYLPLVQLSYRSGGVTYSEETFASVDLADHALLFTRFNLKEGNSGDITTRLVSKTPLHAIGNTIYDAQDQVILSFDMSWQWNAEQKTLTAKLSKGDKATLAIATVPLPAFANVMSASDYDVQKKKCIAKWESILAGAMHVEVPEPIVNAAWKSTIVGSFQLLQGNNMNYSANNQYEVMYEAESGDAVRSLLLWGLKNDSRKMIPPLLDYGINPSLKFHDAAFKLQLLAHYYWLTHDTAFIREQRQRWSACVEILTNKRDQTTGLLPREAYCGDEADKVLSLNSNSNAWCGLRDIAAVLKQIGEYEEAVRINKIAEILKQAIIIAVDKSERKDVQPSFIPIALFYKENPYDTLTSTRRGSYWDLMIPYVIGSKLFSNTERETSMLRYLEEHGGICMGMIRFHQHSHVFANEEGIDDIYGLRYVDALLRRDEPERAIVSFYGKLAQGMTRDTYLNAEGTGLRPLDEFGR
ncbi:MAG TPA: hypothetical protein VIM07_10215, partial [Chitinophagaceae bacterium]